MLCVIYYILYVLYYILYIICYMLSTIYYTHIYIYPLQLQSPAESFSVTRYPLPFGIAQS